MMEQTAGRGNPDRWIRVMEAFLQQGQHGKGYFAQSFGGKQTRLRLLVQQECLEDGECLLLGCSAQRLRGGSTYGRIGMSRKVRGHEDCRRVAQTQ